MSDSVLPPTPRLFDFPASVGLCVGVALTTVLLMVAGRFDPTGGSLTISLLVVLTFIGTVVFSVFFNIPNDELTANILGGLVAAFGAVIAFWLGRPK